MTSTLRPEELTENAVVDPEGKKIGKVGTVYLSDDTQEPEWVTVRTGMFGQKESFVPLRGARLERDGLHVQVSKDQVSDAPRTDADQHLSEQESVELYRYYNLPAPRGSMENTGGRQGRTDTGRTRESGEAMTRSEEQLKVGKEQVETGRVRLRKYTVTEEQQVRVPVTHEEVRIEREPITDRERGTARIGDEEQEMTLHAERAKVEKEAVPMEKVRLRKENVTEEQQLSGEVRKERIEVDEDGRDGRDRMGRRNHP